MLFPVQTRLILPSRLHPKQMATCLPVPARNVDHSCSFPAITSSSYPPSPKLSDNPAVCSPQSASTRSTHGRFTPRPFFWERNLHCRGDPRARSSVKPISKGSPFLLGLRFALSLPFVCQKISYISALAQAVFVPSWIMRLSSRTRPLFQFHAKMQIPPHRPSSDERIVPNGRRSSL